MKLIVWLGNPGSQYKNTRHNVWFMFLDFFAWKNNFPDFTEEKRFKAEISTAIYNGEKTILMKPTTFMNLSWESLRKIVDFYKLDILKDILVVYDDMSLTFGKIRFRDTGSAGGHNGIKDIIKHFSLDFKRIKVWIWFNDNYEVSDWVLSKFTSEELDDYNDNIFPDLESILEKNI